MSVLKKVFIAGLMSLLLVFSTGGFGCSKAPPDKDPPGKKKRRRALAASLSKPGAGRPLMLIPMSKIPQAGDMKSRPEKNARFPWPTARILIKILDPKGHSREVSFLLPAGRYLHKKSGPGQRKRNSGYSI